MKILIVGCGYLGKRLAAACLASGDEVWGLRRDVEHLQDLQGPRFHALSASLLNPNSLMRLPSVDVVVFCQAPSREGDVYADTYLEGTKNLLGALENKKAKKVIFVSSTSVYGMRDGSWVDENDVPDSTGYENPDIEEKAEVLLNAEKYVLSQKIPSMVIRLGGIYGPDRHRLLALKQGALKPILTDTYVNRIQVDDAVAAIRLLSEKGKAGEVYLGVDDNPSTHREFYEWVCGRLELSLDSRSAGKATIAASRVTSKRCLNKKIKSLGLRLRYPDFKSGYTPLVLECLGRQY